MNWIEKMIAEQCPNGVEKVKLEKCCNILDSQRKPVAKGARSNGDIPYYGANGIQDYVSDYIFDGTYVLVAEDGSVITKTGNPVVNWVSGKIWVNNHAHILGENERASLRYLYFILQTLDITPLVHGNIPKLTKGDLKNLEIPLPSLSIQKEIVSVLDKFSELIEKTDEEIALRQKQYEYYREKLLTFEDGEVEWKKLGNLCDIVGRIGFRGYTTKDQVPAYTGALSLSPGNIVDNVMDYSKGTFITWEKYEESPEIMVYNDDIIFCKTGSTVGKVAMIKNLPCKATINPQLVVLKNVNINKKYLYYNLVMKRVQMLVTNLAGIGSVPNISQTKLSLITIPLPSLSRQQEIVDILDKFEALISKLKEERKLRQKQYEYYREKLLTF